MRPLDAEPIHHGERVGGIILRRERARAVRGAVASEVERDDPPRARERLENVRPHVARHVDAVDEDDGERHAACRSGGDPRELSRGARRLECL